MMLIYLKHIIILCYATSLLLKAIAGLFTESIWFLSTFITKLKSCDQNNTPGTDLLSGKLAVLLPAHKGKELQDNILKIVATTCYLYVEYNQKE